MKSSHYGRSKEIWFLSAKADTQHGFINNSELMNKGETKKDFIFCARFDQKPVCLYFHSNKCGTGLDWFLHRHTCGRHTLIIAVVLFCRIWYEDNIVNFNYCRVWTCHRVIICAEEIYLRNKLKSWFLSWRNWPRLD